MPPLSPLLRRFARAFLTVFLLILFTFVALRATGDPAAALIGEDVAPEALADMRALAVGSTGPDAVLRLCAEHRPRRLGLFLHVPGPGTRSHP